jgi:HEPN domain-containing protein
MIHNNHGSIGRLNADNSNTQQTTNHIYLSTGANTIEFNEWKQKIGSLLHIGIEYAGIKPLLDLIIAVIEPQRIFIISNPPIEEYNIKSSIEVILAVDKSNNHDSIKSFLKVACIQSNDITISIHPSRTLESALKSGHLYYSSHCKEEYLVFSGSRYRLYETPTHLIQEFGKDSHREFYEGISNAEEFWNLANDLNNNKQYNLAALMLHQSVEQAYRSILWAIKRESTSSHLIKNIERKAAICIPQISQTIPNKANLEYLDMAYDSQVYPHFDIEQLCDVPNLCLDVKQLIQVSISAFQNKHEMLFGKADTKDLVNATDASE